MKKFWIDCVMATTFVFLAIWGLAGLSNLALFNAFDTIGNALADVDMSDYVYSQDMRADQVVDSNIVIVNIGLLPRRDIAKEIEILAKYKPKVIGVDSFFDCPPGGYDTISCPALADSAGNAMLSKAIKHAGNVILVSKLLKTKKVDVNSVIFDSLGLSDANFRNVAKGEGYASLETDAAFQDDVKTCRSFNPQVEVAGDLQYAFGVKVAMAFDSAKTKQFLKRNNFSEVINYRGNITNFFYKTKYPGVFYVMDYDDVLTENFVPELIKDKIVIMGYLGEKLGDTSWDDKFYTPMNVKLAGKANPDMFGVVVHANIVLMILEQNFIDAMPDWQEGLFAVILCLVNVALFSLINTRFPAWYDGITKLLQFMQLILLTFGMVLVFDKFAYKVSISAALAAVALVGDVYEIYMTVIKNFFFKLLSWIGLTNRKPEVLTS